MLQKCRCGRSTLGLILGASGTLLLLVEARDALQMRCSSDSPSSCSPHMPWRRPPQPARHPCPSLSPSGGLSGALHSSRSAHAGMIRVGKWLWRPRRWWLCVEIVASTAAKEGPLIVKIPLLRGPNTPKMPLLRDMSSITAFCRYIGSMRCQAILISLNRTFRDSGHRYIGSPTVLRHEI